MDEEGELIWTAQNSTDFSETLGSSTSTEIYTLEDSPDNIFRYVQLSSLSLVAFLGFLSNSLVMLLFYKRPTLRTFSNRFVLNLSVSHFCQCILVLPTTVISFATEKWILGDVLCVASGFIFITLNITCALSLLLIALDRNCAVNSPLHYSMTVTKKRTGVLIFITWCLGLLVASPPLFNIASISYNDSWHMCTLKFIDKDNYSVAYGSVLIVLGFLIPFLTTICVYSSMFQAAKDNSERARKHSVETTLPEVRGGAFPPKKKCRRWSSSSNQLFGEEWKAVRTGILVVMTFTLCWLPYFTILAIEAFFDANFLLPDFVLFFVIFCASSACVINPYLYVFRNKTSRKNVKQLICPSNLSDNKKWMFHRQNKNTCPVVSANTCVLAASLVNDSTERVKALPALYQDIEWQVFSTSEDRSREEIEETVSNTSDEDFFNLDISRVRKPNQAVHVQAIYSNSMARNTARVSNKLLLCRLGSGLTRDSTSSETTENCSMSLESTNSSDPAEGALPSRRGIGKYLFNTSEELWESRPSQNKRSNSTCETRKHMSSLGRARRKSFILSHIKNKKSSETTLTLSTPSESSANSKSSKSNRPKLVRQEDTVASSDDPEDL